MKPNRNQKIYFASDFHLGVPSHRESLERERKIVSWLEEIEGDASAIYLMGDLFDFWFEYGKAVPKGFVRLLGKLGMLADRGIQIIIFTGNHDLWMRGYLEEEINATVHDKPRVLDINGKSFYLAHGDGLGPGDSGYKFLKKVFTNKICQWLFARLHPNLGISLAGFFSKRSRNANEEGKSEFLGEDREWLVIHSREILKEREVDYFIYGHRHHPIEYSLGNGSVYINLGDWIDHFSYAEFDGEELKLRYYEPS